MGSSPLRIAFLSSAFVAAAACSPGGPAPSPAPEAPAEAPPAWAAPYARGGAAGLAQAIQAKRGAMLVVTDRG